MTDIRFCPFHRSRQLDDNLLCADCHKQWKQNILEFFWKRYEELRQDYDKAIAQANQDFNDDVSHLADYCERWRDKP